MRAWKLLEFFEDNRVELYNLDNDIGQQNNLAQSMPEESRELHAQLIATTGTGPVLLAS